MKTNILNLNLKQILWVVVLLTMSLSAFADEERDAALFSLRMRIAADYASGALPASRIRNAIHQRAAEYAINPLTPQEIESVFARILIDAYSSGETDSRNRTTSQVLSELSQAGYNGQHLNQLLQTLQSLETGKDLYAFLLNMSDSDFKSLEQVEALRQKVGALDATQQAHLYLSHINTEQDLNVFFEVLYPSVPGNPAVLDLLLKKMDRLDRNTMSPDLLCSLQEAILDTVQSAGNSRDFLNGLTRSQDSKVESRTQLSQASKNVSDFNRISQRLMDYMTVPGEVAQHRCRNNTLSELIQNAYKALAAYQNSKANVAVAIPITTVPAGNCSAEDFESWKKDFKQTYNPKIDYNGGYTDKNGCTVTITVKKDLKLKTVSKLRISMWSPTTRRADYFVVSPELVLQRVLNIKFGN